MNYREVLLEDDLVLPDSGTRTFPLDIQDPITELLLKYSLLNGAAVASNVEPESTISKIEIVDGGASYMSMSGREAVAVATYEKGRWPPSRYIEVLSQTQRITIPIQFGRYVGDPEFAFDPTKLRNPQLRITWAKDDLHLEDNVRLGIIARVMEGVGPPTQCLMTRQVNSWTGAGSGVKTVEMLVDRPYRRLFVRSYLYGSLLSALFSHLKLTCNADKLIVFDLDDDEFADIVRDTFGPYNVRKFDYYEATGWDYKNCLIDGRTIALGTPGSQYLTSIFWASGANYYSCRVRSEAEVDTSSNLQVMITGDFPHATYCYQFGRPMEPETWFQAPEYQDIDLKLSEGGAAANSVLVQQPIALP